VNAPEEEEKEEEEVEKQKESGGVRWRRRRRRRRRRLNVGRVPVLNNPHARTGKSSPDLSSVA
jgi:hypothetical protein